MLVIVQIWDAQNQEVTRRVRATSRRIASKVAEVMHDGTTAKIVPKADATPSWRRQGISADRPPINHQPTKIIEQTPQTTVRGPVPDRRFLEPDEKVGGVIRRVMVAKY